MHFSEWEEINRTGLGPFTVHTNIMVFTHPNLPTQRYLLTAEDCRNPDYHGFSVRHKNGDGDYIWLTSFRSFLGALDTIRDSLQSVLKHCQH